MARAAAAFGAAQRIVAEANAAFYAEIAGWSLFATGRPHPVVNQIVAPIDARAADVPAVLAAMRAHAALFLVHVWHGVGPAVGEALEAAGLRPGDPRPLMTLALSADRARTAAPPGVEIVHVRDTETLAQHRAVDRVAFDDPGVVAETFAPDSILDEPNEGLFLAYLDGMPVGTAVAGVTGDVAGVFGVAVLEEARRRGIGAAVTDAAVAFGAKRGCDLAYLQATPIGEPVYARMGFERVGTYRGYMTPVV